LICVITPAVGGIIVIFLSPFKVAACKDNDLRTESVCLLSQ
jgi:hypothetical protein